MVGFGCSRLSRRPARMACPSAAIVRERALSNCLESFGIGSGGSVGGEVDANEAARRTTPGASGARRRGLRGYRTAPVLRITSPRRPSRM